MPILIPKFRSHKLRNNMMELIMECWTFRPSNSQTGTFFSLTWLHDWPVHWVVKQYTKFFWNEERYKLLHVAFCKRLFIPTEKNIKKMKVHCWKTEVKLPLILLLEITCAFLVTESLSLETCTKTMCDAFPNIQKTVYT